MARALQISVSANMQAAAAAGSQALASLLKKTPPAQLAALVVCVLGTLLLLRKVGPDIFPTVRFWDGSAVGKATPQAQTALSRPLDKSEEI